MSDGPSPRGYSRIQQFLDCQQRWAFATLGVPELHIPRLAPTTRPDYFTFGSAFHAAMAARYRGGNESDMLTAAIELIEKDCYNFVNLGLSRTYMTEEITELIGAYVSQYGSERDLIPIQVDGKDAVEIEVDCRLPHGSLITTRIDLITMYDGVPAVPEHKTTSKDFSRFFVEFDMEAKCTGYIYACRVKLGLDVRNVLINAVRKPNKKAKERVYQLGRHMTQRSDRELERWAASAEQALDLMDAVAVGLATPVQNTAQCINKFTGEKCDYLPLCKYGISTDTLRNYKEPSDGD
jgi:hypothetical protein